MELGKYYRFDFEPISRLLRAFGEILRGDPYIAGRAGDEIFFVDSISKSGKHFVLFPFGTEWDSEQSKLKWVHKKQKRLIEIEQFNEQMKHPVFASCIIEVSDEEIAKVLLTT